MKRVSLISLGCAKNRVDSEIMLGQLERNGYQIVADSEQAETVIVNTCGFIDEAKQESIDTILEMTERKADPDASVGEVLVAGCMVNRYGRELESELPEIDGFIDLDALEEVPKLVQIGGGAAPPRRASHLVFDHRVSRRLTTNGYAYLKVAEGCNNPCTFCAIPHWRGAFRSRTISSLVAEARDFEARGVHELVLVAQDTTRYGEDLGLGRHGLARLLEALLEETDVPWIRFLYAYPTTLDPEVLALMGSEERLVPYLDMPLQHSHPDVLKAMRRGGHAERYSRQLANARELVTDLQLRTTFIVGFPGEGEAEFEHLCEFVATQRFDHLGVFTYSREEATPSAELSAQVDPDVAQARKESLLKLQEPIALASRQRFVGRRISALVEGVCRETEHLLEARHAGMAPDVDGRLLINDGAAAPGSLVEVEVTDAFASDLVGRIVGPEGQPGVVVAPSTDLPAPELGGG